MKYNISFIFLLLLFIVKGQSQEINFEEALQLTLANNYDILMAKVDEEIAENNASIENNDFLPTVSAAGAYNWTYFQGENQLITETQTFDANNSYNYTASGTINYTLFNGQGRRFSYLQAKGNAKLSHLQLQQVIQNTILELSRLYYDIARLEENILSLKHSVDISIERLENMQYQYDYGQVKKLDVLNARVDLNTDSIAYINGVQEIENQKRNLNFIMGREVSQELLVNKEVEINRIFFETEVLESASRENLQLKLNQQDIQLNEYAIGASKSTWLPSLTANAGYQYRGTEDPNGAFVIGTDNFGPQAGISLNWTLYDGRNITQQRNAKLTLANRKIEQQSLQQKIKSEALNALASYRNFLIIFQTQSDNLATANNNFERSKEAFNLGQISSIEFRQAQLNLITAEQNLNKAKYDVKNGEFQLLSVMGILIK